MNKPKYANEIIVETNSKFAIAWTQVRIFRRGILKYHREDVIQECWLIALSMPGEVRRKDFINFANRQFNAFTKNRYNPVVFYTQKIDKFYALKPSPSEFPSQADIKILRDKLGSLLKVAEKIGMNYYRLSAWMKTDEEKYRRGELGLGPIIPLNWSKRKDRKYDRPPKNGKR